MLTLVRMGFPADPSVVVLTTAPPERVEELLREYRDEYARKGWHEELVQDYLRERLPAADVTDVVVRSYSADSWQVIRGEKL